MAESSHLLKWTAVVLAAPDLPMALMKNWKLRTAWMLSIWALSVPL